MIINKTIFFSTPKIYFYLFGIQDKFLPTLEKEFGIQLFAKGDSVLCVGEEERVELFQKLINYIEVHFSSVVCDNDVLDENLLFSALNLIKNNLDKENAYYEGIDFIGVRGKIFHPKSENQKRYIQSIENNTLTFGIGAAGSGKTFLAVAMAVKLLKEKIVEKIILTRPAVEAGEKLGFLPGDLYQKVDPYLKPLFDALHDFMGVDVVGNLATKGVIEIAPLAFMRGRTLSNAFIILDEAQNTTAEQMKMFLTRIGNGSKVVVTGDLTQVDLPNGKISGLSHCLKVLEDVSGIDVVKLTEVDVVRNILVRKIVKAYEEYEKKDH